VLRRQLVARLVAVDRLVLGGVVLEHATEVGEQRDQRQVPDEERHADRALDDDEAARAVHGQPVGDQRGRHLEQHHREADRDREGEDHLPAGELGRNLLLLLALGEAISLTTWAIFPSGLRTATAQDDGERIITPSRTAWPPIAVLMLS